MILIVEDDIELNRGLCSAFKSDGRTVVSVSSINDAREQLSVSRPSLVLLDINLPDGTGTGLLKKIRAVSTDLPVILLTANDTDADVVSGLEAGADDYITKPFSLSVLRARVNTQLRKRSSGASEDIYELDGFMFDFSNMIFKKGEETFELSKTEQKLLKVLVSNKGMTVKRDHLIDKIWTDGSEYVDENALSVSVKRLRDKLGAKEFIRTIYGLGYSWQSSEKEND